MTRYENEQLMKGDVEAAVDVSKRRVATEFEKETKRRAFTVDYREQKKELKIITRIRLN